MIITAQPFFNELDLLEIKCRELAGVVDLHVIVESPMTFTGEAKPLHFARNAERFRGFPILHLVEDLQSVVTSPWERERRAHEHVRAAVRKLCPEIVLFLDADEIPRRDVVERFRALGTPAAHVDMDWITFFFDRIDPTRRPTTARIWRFDSTADWGPWRGDGLEGLAGSMLPDCGWHFDYFNFGSGFLEAKLRAICHAADENGDSMLREVRAGALPGIERTVEYPRDRLPAFVRENLNRFHLQFLGPWTSRATGE